MPSDAVGVSISPSLSIYLSLSIFLSPSIYLSLSIYLSIYLSIHPAIYPSISPSTYLSIQLSIYLSVYLSLSLYLSTYLSIHPSIHPSIYLSPSLCRTPQIGGVGGTRALAHSICRTCKYQISPHMNSIQNLETRNYQWLFTHWLSNLSNFLDRCLFGKGRILHSKATPLLMPTWTLDAGTNQNSVQNCCVKTVLQTVVPQSHH